MGESRKQCKYYSGNNCTTVIWFRNIMKLINSISRAHTYRPYIHISLIPFHQKLLNSRARQLKFKVINKKHPTLLAHPTQKYTRISKNDSHTHKYMYTQSHEEYMYVGMVNIETRPRAP